MKDIWLLAAVILLGTVAVGLVRIVRGPTAADRMLAAQLFGTSGVATLLLLSLALELPRAMDVALVFALLGAVVGVAFATRGWESNSSGEKSTHEPH